MKVKIGPYTQHWSTYRLERRLLNKLHGLDFFTGFVHEKDYTRLDKVIVWSLDVWQWVLNKTVNRFGQERKIKVHIDPYDTWNMDNTLAHIIHPMLIQLRNTNHGAPFVEDVDVPEELRSTQAPPKENDWDTDENHFKRWDWVLDEMIFAFGQEVDDSWESKYYSGEIEHIWKENDDGTHTLEEGPNHTFIVDRDGMKIERDRIQNGLRLFGKYYFNLWN